MRRAVGLAAVVVGLTAVLVGEDPLHMFGTQWLVTDVGWIALGLAAVALVAAYPYDGEHWAPEEVGSGRSVPEPGEDRRIRSDAAFRRRLREHVVDALVDRGHAPERARAMVDDGEWTDDPVAAVHLGDSSLRAQVAYRVALLRADTRPTETLRRRTVAALVRLREEGLP